MFAHVSLGVTDFTRSLLFYDAVMKPLGYERLFGAEDENFMAYGPEESFFIINTPLDESQSPRACNGTHLCFKAPSTEAVDEFYQVAIKMGGVCDGPPGLRPHYADDYYAAFVHDPDGHKIEALARS
jgi:catechol 2,3-dioxygenase-like lactoylglutathione lyase family enzyme